MPTIRSEAKMHEIAVILPTYNEEKTVGLVIESFHRQLPNAVFVVVDNASTDASSVISRTTLRRLGVDGVVIRESRRGKGNALRRAFLEIEAEIYVLVDADMTYPALQVHELVRPIRNGEADIVVGERFSRLQYRDSTNRPMHYLGNRLVCFLVNAFFGGKLVDVMSGYRAMTNRFVNTYPILAEGFQVETEMSVYALERRFRITEIPVDYYARPPGSQSKVNTLIDGVRILSLVFRIFYHFRPMRAFVSAGLILAVFAVIALKFLVANAFQGDGSVYELKLAVAISLGFFASLLFSIGFVLNWLAHQQKLNFETDLRQRRATSLRPKAFLQDASIESKRVYVRAV
jgi:glycosyltransferase involved in cell wall biosynthesis